jgi:hypothetical protein
VARKPSNFQWLGFSHEQTEELDFIDFLGNNGWARNSQTDEIMVSVLDDCARLGLPIDDIVGAMAAIGYHREALRQLRRWESKRVTGRFGR